MSDNYWTRKLARQGISRRRVLGGAAIAGVGTASMALVGCGDDDDDPTPGGPTNTLAPGQTSQPAATPTPDPNAAQPGGTYRGVSANNTWDTFDVDRSRFSPVAWLMGLTNLGVMQWASFTDGVLEGGIAESYEIVDDTTMTFKIRPNVYWHNKPPVNGRQATANDVVKFIERNVKGQTLDGVDDPNFYRKAAWATVDTVEEVDASTVRVNFKRPDPFFLTLLAGSYSKVQAPEAIQQFENDYANMRAELVIGTGAFVLNEWAAEGRSSWTRHEKSHVPINFDGIQWFPLFTDQTAQQAAFEQKQIDAFGPQQTSVLDELLRRFDGQIYERRAFSGNPQAGTYYGGAAPWSDPNLIGGIFRALDRRNLIQTILQGRGALSGNVPPSQSAFSLSEGELIQLPGYKENRDAEIAEAKQMWAAGGGAALGEVVVDIPDIWEGLYSGVSSLITTNLSSILGNTFTAKIEPYSTITGKISEQKYGNGTNNIWYGWITEVSDPEPTVLNYLSYNSNQPQWQQFGIKVDKVDTLTEQAMTEFDIAKRQEISKEVMREAILNNGMGIPYNMVGVGSTLRWNYLKIRESTSFVTLHHWGPYWWFDQKDPTWTGRPA
jgi:peptide/nickel transport system substrate-binding protein